MPKRIFPLFLLLFLFSLFIAVSRVQGDELDDINKQISDLTNQLNQSKSQSAPLEQQLNSIKARVSQIENELVVKQQNIDKGYKDLAKNQKILNLAIKNYYIKSSYNSPLLIFLSGGNATQITRILAYQKAAADADKAIITNIALTINSLQKQEAELKDEQSKLAITKNSLSKIVGDAKNFQANLSNQISVLSARQQQILASRLASLNIPLYADVSGGCSSDIGKSPGFSGAFAFFTYGVPNRVGLNQYGAFGRAKAGQAYDTILRAYYNFDAIESRNATINVEGYGSYSLDEYVKRVYEVPDSWGSQGGMEALKAQAIAARSYALAYTNNGAGSICTTQSCQVFKPDPKGGNWEAAVNATSGMVMVQGGNPIKAFFSSTHGGYIHTTSEIGWSATSYTKSGQDTSSGVGSFADLNNNAYDKDSPWFYCDWGSRSQYGGTAWMQSSEVADIANVLMLAQRDSGTKEHLYQPDKPNPAGTDTWDPNRVRTELRNRGGNPFNSVSSVSIGANFGSGNTSSITISGDAGSQTFSGSDFKTYFNLRAPANIQIVGPLYNVERS
jgi:peptidoglycan hydrolase-like amidase/peptidoglycan hydrolase CwlO-like protein